MKQISREDLLNGWLKYHNTTVEEVIQKHDESVLKSPDWFRLYPVTKEQHDEWVIWAKEHIKKVTKLSKKRIQLQWWAIYLDCAPNIINKNE